VLQFFLVLIKRGHAAHSIRELRIFARHFDVALRAQSTRMQLYRTCRGEHNRQSSNQAIKEAEQSSAALSGK